MNQLFLFQPAATLSVSDLTRYLRAIFESDPLLGDLWVKGEISNFSKPTSGHLYFTLKDNTASLRCVMWRTQAMHLKMALRDGMAVEVHGRIDVYEPAGQMQLYVDAIHPAGEGDLYQAFLRLKARLEAEGLFDPERKRPLPRLPRRIGIVTSPTGAALQDMLNVLRRRYPLAEVILSPSPVQGDEAPAALVAALQRLEAEAPDVILLARGGGSLEDLWAFNDEGVARAVAAACAPVITGVGHETDFTIVDFVADLRAPTPTAAAELCAPDRADLRAGVVELANALTGLTADLVAQLRWDAAQEINALGHVSPSRRVETGRQQVDDLLLRLGQGALYCLSLEQANLKGQRERLLALNPQAVLERGYAILTRAADGQVISRAGQAEDGQILRARLADGQMDLKVLNHQMDDVKE
ncbi:MAG TPA: exodeoxyribonuclease VII large subunit [Anaerolineaceae bacterium]|nr:exodeoxyribonuclease VII large subunit [Anaerolineaceae bacterium]HPN52310.1 exodeoxyribonuclease VII large subunit [Anaerolineaceae bacterium]